MEAELHAALYFFKIEIIFKFQKILEKNPGVANDGIYKHEKISNLCNL
jgi:hypothetical protein